jgi:hypothetical protein
MWSLMIGNAIALVTCTALVASDGHSRAKIKAAKERAAIEAACPRGKNSHAD